MLRSIKLVLVLWCAAVIVATLVIVSIRLQHDPQLGWIAYTTDSQYLNNNPMKIRVRWLDGGTSHIINQQFLNIFSLAWSPTGGEIAVLAAGDTVAISRGGVYYAGLYLMRPDGRNLRQLAQFDDGYVTGGSVIWSDDGERIMCGISTQNEPLDTFRIRTYGSYTQKLQGDYSDGYYWQGVEDPESIIATEHDGGDYDRMWAQFFQGLEQFSPETGWRLDVILQGNRREIYGVSTRDIDTTPESELILVAPHNVDPLPFWSHDGQHIWFTTRRGEEPGSNLYRYDITADTLSLIMSNDTQHLTSQTWVMHDQLLLLTARQVAGRSATDGYLVSATDPESATPIHLPNMLERDENLQTVSWKPNPDHALQWGKLLAILIGGLGLALVLHRYSG